MNLRKKLNLSEYLLLNDFEENIARMYKRKWI